MKNILEGKRPRGRKSNKMMLDDLKNASRYQEMKEEARNRRK